jgi:hypothetical protein
MAKKPLPKRVEKTPVLAYVGFGLGILALLPMAIMSVDFIAPMPFANAMSGLSTQTQSFLLFYYMLGSLPFAIAALVTGGIALRRIKKAELNGDKWAILAIVLGGLGLVFGVFLYLHFVTTLQVTPPIPT